MIRARSALALGVLVGVAAGRAMAAVGTSTGAVLLEPLSARPAALGEAYAAEGGTIEALGYNPAGLAELVGVEGSALVRQGFAGDTFASLLGGGEFRGFGVGAGIAYQATGPVDWLDPTGRISTVTAQSDLVGMAALAHGIPGIPVFVGATVKIVRSSLLEEAAATDFAADLGAQAVVAPGLRVGASLQHWGGHLRYDDEKWPVDNNPLPLLVRFGASWTVAVPVGGSTIGTLESTESPGMQVPPPPHALRFLAGADLRRLEHAVGYGGGIEYGYAGTAFLRGGYRILESGWASRESAWSIGLGVAFAGLRVDYAAEMLSFTTFHRVGLTFVRFPEPD